MKILNNIKFKILIFVLSISMFGCKDSFLDLVNKDAISPAVFPTTVAQLDIILASVYGEQHDWGFLGGAWHGYAMYPLDHTCDFQWRQDEGWLGESLGRAILGWASGITEWRDISRGVYYANSCLEAIETYRKTAPAAEKQQIDIRQGQALFLRAFYWWHLQEMYGQPNLDGMGIPIIKSVPKDLVAMNVPRSSTLNSYQAMINDFKKAADLLVGQTDVHRATVWSAKAALARTYMFAAKLDSAKIYLEDCINNSGKTLVPFSSYKNMFNGNSTYEYNSESFYEVGNKAEPDKTNGNGARQANTGSTITLLYTPIYVYSDGTRKAMGYSNLYMHDRNLTRFGYNDLPMLKVVEQVNGVWKLKDSYVAQQKDRRNLVGTQADGPDPRLYVCGLQPMVDSVKIAGVYYKVGMTEFGNWWTLDPTTNLDPATFYGWALKKNQYLDGTLAETMNIAGANFYFIRLPDIYLLYAEIIKSTNPTLALEYINKVHRRAYSYDPNAVSPVDYKSLTDRTKTAADDHLANNPLLYERWAEFFGEGRWWEDVRRFKIGGNEASFYKTVAAGRVITWRDENYAMPLPPLEFESNGDPGMKQNPGY